MKTCARIYGLTLALPLAAVLGLSEARAQDGKENNNAPPTQTEEKSASTAPAPEKQAPAAQAEDDVFIPTEEISEDLSVSFPVDI